MYATLQQVQRRITEQAGGPTSVSTPAGMQPPGGRAPASGNPTPGPQPVIRTGPQLPQPGDASPLSPLLPPGHAAHQRYAVVLSGTLVSLLLVCWIASLAVAILVTYQICRQPLSMPSDQPTRMVMTAETAPSEPKYKLVVKNNTRATVELRKAFAQDRDYLNGVMRKNADRGWQPWFEIEEGINGSIQLVFAKQGVDKAQWAEFVNLLVQQRQYASATWVGVGSR